MYEYKKNNNKYEKKTLKQNTCPYLFISTLRALRVFFHL